MQKHREKSPWHPFHLLLGSMFQKAYSSPTSPTDIIIDTLNFALTLEYLESNFYIKAVASGIIPAGDALNALTVIRDHENEHVNFLKTAISAAGATPVSFTADSFDFTAKGTFPGVFSDYGTFWPLLKPLKTPESVPIKDKRLISFQTMII